MGNEAAAAAAVMEVGTAIRFDTHTTIDAAEGVAPRMEGGLSVRASNVFEAGADRLNVVPGLPAAEVAAGVNPLNDSIFNHYASRGEAVPAAFNGCDFEPLIGHEGFGSNSAAHIYIWGLSLYHQKFAELGLPTGERRTVNPCNYAVDEMYRTSRGRFIPPGRNFDAANRGFWCSGGSDEQLLGFICTNLTIKMTDNAFRKALAVPETDFASVNNIIEVGLALIPAYRAILYGAMDPLFTAAVAGVPVKECKFVEDYFATGNVGAKNSIGELYAAVRAFQAKFGRLFTRSASTKLCERMIFVRAQAPDFIALIAYVFRQRAHHWTDDSADTYNQMLELLGYQSPSVPKMATLTCHAIPPLLLDYIWVCMSECGGCSSQLKTRTNVLASGQAQVLNTLAAWSDVHIAIPDTHGEIQAMYANLQNVAEQLDPYIPDRRWVNAVTYTYYFSGTAPIPVRDVSFIAAMSTAVLQNTARRQTTENKMSKSRALQKAASNLPTAVYIAQPTLVSPFALTDLVNWIGGIYKADGTPAIERRETGSNYIYALNPVTGERFPPDTNSPYNASRNSREDQVRNLSTLVMRESALPGPSAQSTALGDSGVAGDF